MDSIITELETKAATLNTTLDGKAAGGGSGGGVETYTLIIQSDGVTKVSHIEYTAYVNGAYQYHNDTLIDEIYPVTLNNVVLNTPLQYSLVGGYGPLVEPISNFELMVSYDYIHNILNGSTTDGFLPLTSDNGQIIIRVFDDD